MIMPRKELQMRQGPTQFTIKTKMPEFQSVEVTEPESNGTQFTSNGGGGGGGGGGNMPPIVETMHNKKPLLMNRQVFSSANSAATATSNEKHTSSSSSTQIVSGSHSSSSTSTTSSKVSKRSQMMTHSMSASEMNLKKANESFLENRNFGRSLSMSGPSGLKLAGGPQRVFSMEKLPISEEMIVPEEMSTALVPVVSCQEVLDDGGGGGGGGGNITSGLSMAASMAAARAAASATTSTTTTSSATFEQKQMTASKVKVVTDGFAAEKIEATKQGMRMMQSGDLSFEEKHRASAVKEKLETDSFSAEKTSACLEEQVRMKAGEMTQQEQRRTAAASMKVATEGYTAEKTAMAKQAERQTVTAHGVTHQEKHMAASASSKMVFSKGISSSSSQSSSSTSSSSSKLMSSSQMGSGILRLECPDLGMLTDDTGKHLEDLDKLSAGSCKEDVDKALAIYSGMLSKFVDFHRLIPEESVPTCLKTISDVIHKAWAIPSHGHTLGSSLCDVLRNNGGLDILIKSCCSHNEKLLFCSARVLEQCLTTENRSYIADNGLINVLKAARVCSDNRRNLDFTRVGTGILEHLFKHSESTCRQVIRQGGLKSVINDSRYCNDVETLRHCSSALANLSLYGGSENHQAMIHENVQNWLFPLAFHDDDNIKYYACLALATLVANKEIEAAVNRSGALNLVEPFLMDHDPAEFASSTVAHIHGHSKDWLQRLVPVLNSNRREAQSLAAFHFVMEAGIKNKQGNTEIFREIGAIESLKKVASSPNAIASKYAAQALKLMDEELPHQLSQQVPLWTVEDVTEWLKQIGFSYYYKEFVGSRVDGDLLLQLNEGMLIDDIRMSNGILRKRFMRELGRLKKMTDYSSCDFSDLHKFLLNVGPEMTQYTYPLLNAGVDMNVLKYLSDDQLFRDCGIDNSIHRLRILENVRVTTGVCNPEVNVDKNIDVFISYRRSNGSQLASLLKVHLELRGFRVFIDVERLEAGKFDNNLLQSVRQAKHLILVLTQSSLDRCIGDNDHKDWIHREVVAALTSHCNIIPLTDNFQWPEPEQLPEDMRAVCYFNGVRWIHDYQEACVEKLERFIRGETKVGDGVLGRTIPLGGAGTPGTPSTMGRPGTYQRSQSNESKGSHNSDKDCRETALVNGKDSVVVNGIVTHMPE